jgi:hypothetical protein
MPPDEIWFVDTTIKEEWTVLCLRRRAVLFPDEDTPVRYTDFDAASLNEVSGRLVF